MDTKFWTQDSLCSYFVGRVVNESVSELVGLGGKRLTLQSSQIYLTLIEQTSNTHNHIKTLAV
jgi:hypothetical protein